MKSESGLALPSARSFSGSARGMSGSLACRRTWFLSGILLFRGLFGPHLFQFPHVFGFHVYKNATIRALSEDGFTFTYLGTPLVINPES